MWRGSGALGIFLWESSKRVLLLLFRPLKYLWRRRWTSSSFLFLEARVFPSFPAWLSSDSSRTCPSRNSQIWNREMSKRAMERVNRISRQPIQDITRSWSRTRKKNVSIWKQEMWEIFVLIWQEGQRLLYSWHLSLSLSVLMRWRWRRRRKMPGMQCHWLICNLRESLSPSFSMSLFVPFCINIRNSCYICINIQRNTCIRVCSYFLLCWQYVYNIFSIMLLICDLGSSSHACSFDILCLFLGWLRIWSKILSLWFVYKIMWVVQQKKYAKKRW